MSNSSNFSLNVQNLPPQPPIPFNASQNNAESIHNGDHSIESIQARYREDNENAKKANTDKERVNPNNVD